MLRPRMLIPSLLTCVLLSGASAAEATDRLSEQATAALKKAASFYRNTIARHGGYVYYTSLDLQERWGEGLATDNQVWVQPPGTPAVGLAYLSAYEATGDRYYLEAARETAGSLLYGQLESGGWTNVIDFDPKGDRVSLYRNGRGRGRNFSSLDDGTSQAAIRFLTRLDGVLRFQDTAIHQAAQVALDALLAAQFPNGAFPQGWEGPASPQRVLPANYPAYDWRTEGRVKNYWDQYTLNDGLAGTVVETLITAWEVYEDERYRTALMRFGDFLCLAQMPDPQPAWAQQYNYQMQPIWARAFEPPAIAGRESQDVIAALMKIFRSTGEKKYLEPIPKALAYLRQSRLADGSLARYYELKTNRPLYMTRQGRDYRLTYDDSDLPSHYGWKSEYEADGLAEEFRLLRDSSPASKSAPDPEILERQVRQIISDLEGEGRWISIYGGERLVGQPKFSPQMQYIDSAVFIENVETLSQYLGAPARGK